MSKRQHTKKSPTDETLYCERCGISFLWSSEEQVTHPDAELANELAAVQANVSPRPPLCPGCRKLLPQASRERGLVKWFNHRKRYGFLTRTGQPDLFVHRSEISPGARLHPGDLVEFTVSESRARSFCDAGQPAAARRLRRLFRRRARPQSSPRTDLAAIRRGPILWPSCRRCYTFLWFATYVCNEGLLPGPSFFLFAGRSCGHLQRKRVEHDERKYYVSWLINYLIKN